MKWFRSNGWSPYLAGALTGLLAIISVFITTQWLGKSSYIGASTTFVRAAGFIESAIAPEHVAQNEYFKKEKVKLDWQFMLVTGIFFGALASSLLDKSFKIENTPPIWNQRFGNSCWKRFSGAFFGGILLMFGARMADGCPSGHGLSGTMQLSLSGIVALIFFFAAGVVVAKWIYQKEVP